MLSVFGSSPLVDEHKSNECLNKSCSLLLCNPHLDQRIKLEVNKRHVKTHWQTQERGLVGRFGWICVPTFCDSLATDSFARRFVIISSVYLNLLNPLFQQGPKKENSFPWNQADDPTRYAWKLHKFDLQPRKGVTLAFPCVATVSWFHLGEWRCHWFFFCAWNWGYLKREIVKDWVGSFCFLEAMPLTLP